MKLPISNIYRISGNNCKTLIMQYYCSDMFRIYSIFKYISIISNIRGKILFIRDKAASIPQLEIDKDSFSTPYNILSLQSINQITPLCHHLTLEFMYLVLVASFDFVLTRHGTVYPINNNMCFKLFFLPDCFLC